MKGRAWTRSVAAATSVWSSSIAMAQGPAPVAPLASVGSVTPPVQAAPPRPGWSRIPAGLPVDIEIVDSLSSKTNVHGDHFAIRLASPITIDGRTLVAAGAMGVGEVIQGSKARAAGKAGELIITTRKLDDGDIAIPLGHFHFAEAGKDNGGAAMAVALAASSVLSLLIVGGEVVVPAGTRGLAKTTQDIDVPIPGAVPATPTSTTTTTAAPNAAL